MHKIFILVAMFHCWFLQASIFSEQAFPKTRFMNTEITLLAPEVLYSTNITDIETLNSWTAIVSELVMEIGEIRIPQNIAIFQILLSNDSTPKIEIITETPISEELYNEFESTLMAITPPEVKIGKMAFRISIWPRSLSKKRVDALHDSIIPHLQFSIDRFQELSLNDKMLYLEEWSKMEAIPVLTEYAKVQFPNSEGIKKLVAFIEKHKNHSVIPFLEYAQTNPLYWRSVFEMPADSPLAPTLELLSYASNGSLDITKRLLNITLPFSSIQKPSGYYLDQLATYLQLIQQDLAYEIHEIRGLKEAKQLEEAIENAESLLTSIPGQPMVLHEYIQLNILKRQSSGEDVSLQNILSPELERQLYQKDPFFIGSTVIRNARDAYNHIKRNEINSLFKTPEKYRENLLDLSILCLDLKSWHFAAHLFHRSLYYTESNPEQMQAIVAYFLYSLEQMNITDFKSNFPGDHLESFANIHQELTEKFESSEVYRGFQGVHELRPDQK